MERGDQAPQVQPSLTEAALEFAKDRILLVSGCAIWAFNGAITGGRQYLQYARETKAAEAVVREAEAITRSASHHSS